MYRAIFIDAMGTMLELEPPWERIDPLPVAGIPPRRVREAFETEMDYYRAHAEQGSDREPGRPAPALRGAALGRARA